MTFNVSVRHAACVDSLPEVKQARECSHFHAILPPPATALSATRRDVIYVTLRCRHDVTDVEQRGLLLLRGSALAGCCGLSPTTTGGGGCHGAGGAHARWVSHDSRALLRPDGRVHRCSVHGRSWRDVELITVV